LMERASMAAIAAFYHEGTLDASKPAGYTRARRNTMATIDDVIRKIDRQELVQLALDVCNIPSGGPTEKAVADYVTEWFAREGFKVRQVGLLAERPNVLARLSGTGGGYSLIFNSHMDTSVRPTDVWLKSDPTADIHYKAWIEGEELVGEGIVNDKGPMTAFMIAAKAVKN